MEVMSSVLSQGGSIGGDKLVGLSAPTTSPHTGGNSNSSSSSDGSSQRAAYSRGMGSCGQCLSGGYGGNSWLTGALG